MYKVIFDADGIVYRVGFALEDVGSERVVRKRVQEYIDYHMGQVNRTFSKVEKVPTIVLSAPGQSNFRYEFAKTLPYKGNRTAPKPKHYDLIRKILSESDNFLQVEGQEADDTIADLTAQDPENTVVISQDKDLLQNPGWYYIPGGKYMTYVEDEDGEMEYREVECTKRPVFYVPKSDYGYLQMEMHTGGKKSIFGVGKSWLAAQMLLGDPADNIPGVKGYGAVKVFEKLLDAQDPLEVVWNIYHRLGIIDRFDEVLRLLTIGGVK